MAYCIDDNWVKKLKTLIKGDIGVVADNVNAVNATVENHATRIGNLQSGISQLQSDTKSIDTKVNNIKIGGRNLVLGTTKSKAFTFSGSTSQTYYLYNSTELTNGKQVTISFNYDNSLTSGNINFLIQGSWQNITAFNINNAGKDNYFSTTLTLTKDVSTTNSVYLQGTGIGDITIKNLKIEEGNKPTDWSPAYEDYLPLSGGTIANDNFKPLVIKRNDVQYAAIGFENSSGSLGSIGMKTVDGNLVRIDSTSSNFYSLLDTNNFTNFVTIGKYLGAISPNGNNLNSSYLTYDSDTCKVTILKSCRLLMRICVTPSYTDHAFYCEYSLNGNSCKNYINTPTTTLLPDAQITDTEMSPIFNVNDSITFKDTYMLSGVQQYQVFTNAMKSYKIEFFLM